MKITVGKITSVLPPRSAAYYRQFGEMAYRHSGNLLNEASIDYFVHLAETFNDNIPKDIFDEEEYMNEIKSMMRLNFIHIHQPNLRLFLRR